MNLLLLCTCITTEQMGGLIQQRLKDQALAEGGTYVGAKDQGSTDKVKYNRAREPWKSTTHASQRKPPAGGGATAVPHGQTASASQQQSQFVSDLSKKLNKMSASDGKGRGKPGRKPQAPPTTAKPRQQQPRESQPIYGNTDTERAQVYSNVDFGNQIYANTQFQTDQISGVTKEVLKKDPRMRHPGKPGPAPGHPHPGVAKWEPEDYYDNMDGEIYEDMNADEEDEEMYVVPNPGEEEEY